MTPTAAAPSTNPVTWSAKAPQVRKAIAFVRARETRGLVTNAEDLVEWDRSHGRRLFEWDDDTAAADWRVHQARLFLNSFRGMFNKMRVRAFIHIQQDDLLDIPASGYVTVQAIADHPGMRSQVIEDIMRRMKTLASELRMWKLTREEQTVLFDRLADAMSGHDRDEAA